MTAGLHVERDYVDLLRAAGIVDSDSVYVHSGIRVWRSILERENATLDLSRPDGARLRLHIKRDKRPQRKSPSDAEATNILALRERGVPTANLVAHGRAEDGRSFVITEHLEGFEPADRLIRSGVATFTQLTPATAQLAAKLHKATAFHRDLYLCHMFARQDGNRIDIRLIDCARVLTDPFLRRRWAVKDLAQFMYSTREFSVSETELENWFGAYAAAGGLITPAMRRGIAAKTERIAKHDVSLRRSQPDRNVSIPD